MIAIFAHDHVFVRWQDQLYSPGRLPYAAFVRYLEHFETLIVVARVRSATSESEISSLQRSDGPRVRFVLQEHQSAIRSLFAGRAFKRRLIPVLERADAVIVRLPSRLGSLVANAARRLQKPTAAELVQSAFHALWYHGSVITKVYAPILDRSTRRITSRVDSALYVTNSYLQKRYPCPNHTAAASNVELSDVGPAALARRLQRIASRQGPLCLGFVGTLDSRHKGLDTALLALSGMRDSTDWRFDIVGEGNQGRWQALAESLGIASRVRFLGVLPGSKAVRLWMQEIDIYLQPSHTEGLPRALIEAMSEGCLAVASNVSGIPELLPAEYLHPPGDAQAVISILSRILATPGEFESAAQRNFDVSCNYTSDRLAQVRREFFAKFASIAASRTAS